MTLYQMRDEYIQLLALAEDPETDAQIFMDTLEALQGDIEDKAEGYVCVIKELQAEQDKFAAEIKRLTDRCAVIDNHINHMKDTLLQTMTAMGEQKIKTEHFRVSIAKNGGLRPLKITGDVPDTFMKLVPQPDNKAIREALDEGFELNFAHLEERGTHLNIR